jgi:DNA-binding Lrp family transcriptional regulator
MSVKAYILATTTAGKTSAVLETLRSQPLVKSAVAVTGPYDVIISVEADELEVISHLVNETLHRIEGVERTVTCLQW